MKLPKYRVWTYGEAFEYFLPSCFASLVLYIIGVPLLWVIWLPGITTFWAIFKYNQ